MSPLRRFQTPAASCVPVAGAQQPLVKLAALQSVVCADVPGLLGYPDPANASSFPTDRGGLPPSPSPCLLRNRVHPLVSFVLLQSSFWQSSARARHLAALPRAPPVGSPPSSRRQHAESTVNQASRARSRSVLSVSHALDGLLLLVPCASISLRCRVQGSRSRGFLLRPGRTTFRWPLPSRRWRRRLPVARLQRTSRRPQGLAPARSPQCPAGFLSPPSPVSPPAFFNSLGLVSRDLGRAVALPPLAALSIRCCVCPVPMTLSVSISL